MLNKSGVKMDGAAVREIVQRALADALQRQKDAIIGDLTMAVTKNEDDTLSEARSLFTTGRADFAAQLKTELNAQRLAVQNALRQQEEHFLFRACTKPGHRRSGKTGTSPGVQRRMGTGPTGLRVEAPPRCLQLYRTARQSEDEEAFTSVSRAFPILDKDHIGKAIDHVHTQVYGCLPHKGWEWDQVQD